MNFRFSLVLIFIAGCLSTSFETSGQGCSDAGFCSINSFKPQLSDSSAKYKNQLLIGSFYGGADNAIAVYGSYLEFYRQINSKLGLDAKITSLGQSGNGITAFSVSDLFLNLDYKLIDQFKLTIGTKIPFSGANQAKNGLPLPMDYQSSLGTVDLILGFAFDWNKLMIASAIQQPFTQNDNQFLSSRYPISSPLRQFQSTNQFRRKGDVLIRIAYPVIDHGRCKVTASLLPIYHLANDQYTDDLNIVRDINGSKGLTLNGNLFFDYHINSKKSIQLNAGVPFIVRDARPDGLTRSFIVNLEYKIKF
jgi:hypothetical protein